MGSDLPVWIKILSGLIIVALLFFFGPGTWRMLKNGPKGTANDWLGLAKPVAIVVAVIVVLIWVLRA